MNNREVRKHKELSILREGVHSNWRDELQEEHPFVDVMPSTGDKQKEIEKKMKELKKAKKAEKEEVKEEMEDAPVSYSRKTDGRTMQDGPRPTPKQRKGALQHQQREINRLENTSDERNLTASEKARLNLYRAKRKVWEKDSQEPGE